MTTATTLQLEIKAPRQILGVLGADHQGRGEDYGRAVDGIYVYQAVCQGVDEYRRLRLQA